MPYQKCWSIKTPDWELVALKWDLSAGCVEETWREIPPTQKKKAKKQPGNMMVWPGEDMVTQTQTVSPTPRHDKVKDKKQPDKKNKRDKTTKKEKTIKKEKKNKKGRAGCSRA